MTPSELRQRLEITMSRHAPTHYCGRCIDCTGMEDIMSGWDDISCGCEITSGLDMPRAIKRCPLHNSAPALLSALTAIQDAHDRDGYGTREFALEVEQILAEQARDAIRAASGRGKG